MRIRDIILESDLEFEAIEDEADSRGDSALITALEWLRNEATQSSAVTPRVKVDTVIDRVRNIPGNEAFNYAALEAANEHNKVVQTLIKDIKDDDKTGSKYIYLALPENQIDPADPLSVDAGVSADSSKVVNSMAKRAAGK